MTAVHDLDETVESLKALGFSPADGEEHALTRVAGPDGYRLNVKLNATSASSRIDFGADIAVGRPVGLGQRESIVVIECVIQLLEAGYSAASISLEKAYRLGHGPGGWLDVLVSKNGRPYWMIECKTAGTEYKKFLTRLRTDGGQLFTYWLQDRDVEWLTLYSSQTNADMTIFRENVTLPTKSFEGSSVDEVYRSWNGGLSEADIFSANPYELQNRLLRVRDLRDIREEDSGEIFHAFEEILRRNAVSDKPNAFNKIFNLFICKVQDEEKTDPESEVEFRWGEEEDSELVLNRLSKLYAEGLDNFLQVELPNHTLEELGDILQSLPGADRDRVLRAFSELKSLSNSDFSFIDVFDPTTLRKNAQVVKEVVQLLENIRIRYTHKQPFMGEFFERLLNTSVKQEQGQYFTPIPLARFVLNGLPLTEITQTKKDRKDTNFLPYIIDYAAGAGHFLTEGMDVVGNILNAVDTKTLNRSQQDNVASWSNLKWAKEFVYGIEKDYRLAKTAKVACFLNGDGEANIITADGLAKFNDPESGYVKRLVGNKDARDNPKFDVVVANPPYSVEDCKSKVVGGSSSFELWPKLTPSSDDIECLFAERTKQLLVTDGAAGIIFPSSIAQATGNVFADTRRILLRSFDIKGLVSLGTGAFSDANVRTTVFFMKRVDDSGWKNIASGVDRFLTNWTDLTIDGKLNPISTYARSVWDLSLDEYTDILRNKRTDTSERFTLPYARYAGSLRSPIGVGTEAFWAHVLLTERSKMKYFLRTLSQKVVVANSPASLPDQKTFLGYGFKSVNGTRSMIPTRDAATQSVISQSGKGSLAAAISANFSDALETLPDNLAGTSAFVALHDLIDFKQGKFDLAIATVPPRPEIISKYPTKMLADLVDDLGGIWTGRSKRRRPTPILRSTQFKERDVLAVGEAEVVEADEDALDDYLLKPGDILVERSGGSENQHVGRARLFEGSQEPVAFGNFMVRLRKRAGAEVTPEFLFHFLQHQYDTGAFAAMQRATNGFQNLDLDRLLRMRVPIIPQDEQVEALAHISSLRATVDDRMAAVQRDSRALDALLDGMQSVPLRDVAKKFDDVVRVQDLPEEVNLVELKNIEQDSGRRIGLRATPRARIESNKRSFAPGDVLYGRLRPNLNKVLVADGDGYASTEILIYRPTIDPVLLSLGLRRSSFLGAAVDAVKGMKMPRVPEGRLDEFQVPTSTDVQELEALRALDMSVHSALDDIAALWEQISTIRSLSLG